MKAAVTNERPRLRGRRPTRPAPGPDQLVIRVAACGVCGSDIKAQPFAPAGMVMGHELGGEVVAVGSQRRRLAGGHQCRCPAGDFVWIASTVRPAWWRTARRAQLHRDGSGGRFRRVRRRPRTPRLRATRRTARDLLGAGGTVRGGLHGVHSAEISPGDDVLIVGAGGVGLTTLVWALQKGGARVTVADPDPRRREMPSHGRHRRPGVRLRRRAAAYDVASNASGGPNSCRPASRRCGHGVASSSPVPAPNRPPSNPSPRCSRNSPSATRSLPARRVPRSDRRIRSR